MKRTYQRTPKEKRDEIVSVFLSGDNSAEELAEYYNVNPHTIRTWIKRYRHSKKVVSLQAECWRALFGGFAPPAAWQTTAVFFIVVNSFRKKTTFSVKVSTFLVNCQLIQEIDCQLHQEKSNKLSTKIRKRHFGNYRGHLVKVKVVIFDFGNAVIAHYI